MSQVKLDQVSKCFGETVAVSGLNLEINEGEFVGTDGNDIAVFKQMSVYNSTVDFHFHAVIIQEESPRSP